jgi:hypothetical protein
VCADDGASEIIEQRKTNHVSPSLRNNQLTVLYYVGVVVVIGGAASIIIVIIISDSIIIIRDRTTGEPTTRTPINTS